MGAPELPKQRQPDVLPQFEPSTIPSLWVYVLLLLIAAALVIAAFAMRIDWPGLFLNLAASIFTAVLLLVFVDRRLRTSEVHRLKRFPHELRAQTFLVLSSQHRQLASYAKAYLKALAPLVSAKIETTQFKNLDAAGDKSFVLQGVPGSGKTTLLQMLAAHRARGFADGKDKLPVIYPLRSWNSARPLEGAILEHINGFAPVSWRALNHALKSGQILLILDGVDELSVQDARVFLSELSNFTAAYPRVPVIVSSRPKDGLLAGDLPTVELAPLTHDEVRKVIEARHAERTREKDQEDWNL